MDVPDRPRGVPRRDRRLGLRVLPRVLRTLNGIRLEAAAVSDIGNHRSSNQDSAFSSESCAAVADGVGGGPAGDIASAVLLHRFAAGGFRITEPDGLRTRLQLANWDIGALTRHDTALEGMATTFTGVFLTGDRLMLAHVGDSRGYLLRDGALVRRTRDDSYVQQLVDAGLVSASDAFTHPRRNIVTATFSGAATDADTLSVQVDVARTGDRWLLCSDGVSDYLPDDAIAPLLGPGTPGQAAQRLVSVALQAGSRDNVTAVVCDVVAGAVAARPSVTFVGAAGDRYLEEPA